MRNRASLLIVCPRCGLGNRLRVMVSAIDVAQRLGLRLAHLWRRDAPVRSTYLMPDEELGAGSCDFETLFEPIPFLEPFADEGQTVRLLSEHAHLCQQQGIRIVDELHHPRGLIARSHLEGVGALLLLTSESLPVREPTKIELYDRYFTPTTAFADMLEARRDDLQGRWPQVPRTTRVGSVSICGRTTRSRSRSRQRTTAFSSSPTATRPERSS